MNACTLLLMGYFLRSPAFFGCSIRICVHCRKSDAACLSRMPKKNKGKGKAAAAAAPAKEEEPQVFSPLSSLALVWAVGWCPPPPLELSICARS